MRTDEKLELVIKHLGSKEAWPESIKRFQVFSRDLRVEDGALTKNGKLVLPEKLKGEALKIAHAAHPGATKMKSSLRKGVWWPGIDADIEQFVKSCPHCQLITDTSRPLPIALTELPNNPWEFIAMDFSTASDKEGWKALVLTDCYSRFLVAVPMEKTDAVAVKRELEKVFRTYYLPKTIKADNGPPFNSEALRSWLEAELGIKLVHSTPLNPTENGLVERQMQGINKVAAIARLEKRGWKEVLAEYVTAYNSWPHSITRIPPAELMFGRAIRGALPDPRLDKKQNVDDELRERDHEAKSRRNVAEDQKRGAVVKTVIEKGDRVLMKQQKADKVDTIYKNAFFEVQGVDGNGRVELKELTTGRTFWRNVKHLKKF